MSNTHKTVIVTGASTGIGLATVQMLTARGYRVAAGFHGDPGCLARLVEEDRDSRLTVTEIDVTDTRATTGFVDHVAARSEQLYGVVTSAGIHSAGDSHLVDLADWGRVLAVNLTGTFATVRAALPHMIPKREGRIVTIASELGIAGQEKNAAYCASKGGVISLTKSLAREYAAQNILVNCVAPGPVLTDMLKASSEYHDGSALTGMPIGRYGEPDEIAEVIEFLMTAGSFMVGQIMSPNGGAVI